jgi:hypothetical protein
MVFLHSHGVGTARAVRIYKTYGPDAIQIPKTIQQKAFCRPTLRTIRRAQCSIDCSCNENMDGSVAS